MKIGAFYSHLNGFEWIMYHHPKIWGQIRGAIKAVDAKKCKTKASKEKTKKGKIVYSPTGLNLALKKELNKRGWKETRSNYYVTDDMTLTRNIVTLPPSEQKKEILSKGKTPLHSFNQTDFEKHKVAIEVQFGKYAFIEFDLFVKHLGFYIGGQIEVGVEIVPMKALEREMSSGPGYYERVLNHLARQGRGSPAVPLILIGVMP